MKAIIVILVILMLLVTFGGLQTPPSAHRIIEEDIWDTDCNCECMTDADVDRIALRIVRFVRLRGGFK